MRIALVLFAAACSTPSSTPPAADPPVADPPAQESSDAASSPEPALALPDAGGAEPLAHLEGCWQARGTDGDQWLVTYTRPMGGIVLGTTRQIQDGRVVTDELERFVVEADGTLVVTPIANGIPRDSFAAAPGSWTRGDVAFERRGHGFPQVLRYHRHDDVLDIIARDDERGVGMKLRAGPCL